MVEAAPKNGVICASRVLKDGQKGWRFDVEIGGKTFPAFAIRHRGRVHAFLNQCAHQGIELDWKEGYFFDIDGEFLICATHGALYYPDSGTCAGGPCAGGALISLAVSERDDIVHLVADGVQLVDQARNQAHE